MLALPSSPWSTGNVVFPPHFTLILQELEGQPFAAEIKVSIKS